jgi:serine phosphatase RsbU (regulator of sigma subunit)
MDETRNRLPRLLDRLGSDQFLPILERFGQICPFPLWLINPEGKVIAATPQDQQSQGEARHFSVDPVTQTVTDVRASSDSDTSSPCLAVPIYVHGEIVGYVVPDGDIPSDQEETYKHRMHTVADFVGEKAYAEYELENLTEELIEKYNEVNLIYDISEALGAVLDAKTVCEIIVEKAVDVIGVEKASIMLYDETSDRLYIAASYGINLPEEKMRQIRVAPGEGVSGKVFATGKHLLIENSDNSMLPDLPHDDRGYKKKSFVSVPVGEYKKKSFLSIPMIFSPMKTERKVMGVINMTDKKSSDMFTSGDLRLLTAVASQAAMSLYNIRLIEEVKDAERVKREMEIAQQIQMGLLPGTPPRLDGLDLAGRCLPATQVGGDYYDFFPNSNDKLGVVIADVSGHNVGAALMMAAARSTLRSEVLAHKSPAKVLENTNFVLYEDLTHAELFITMFYAEYEARTQVLRYSNGGHNHPIVVRQGTCRFLNTEGMLIGMLESVDFEEKTIGLEPKDFVVFYTDGVVEAKNKEGVMFTVDRLCQVVERADQTWNADELLERIYTEVARHSGNALRSDDITVVVLKVD